VQDPGHHITAAGRTTVGQSAGRGGHEGMRIRILEEPVGPAAFLSPDACHA
jgi:hypothetical protein